MQRKIICGTILLVWMARALAAVEVPPELRGWENWVLHGEEYRRCPVRLGQMPGNVANHVCAWPDRLHLEISAGGATFTQSWRLYTPSWLPLPGNREHWPQDVRVDDRAGSIVDRNGTPALHLPAGEYRIQGRFSWDRRPDSLAVPAEIALIDLSLDGQSVAQPERSGNGLWLGEPRNPVQDERQLDLRVFRHLADGVPMRLTTRIQLRVSGPAREEVLAAAVPPQFVPVNVISPVSVAASVVSSLPAKLEEGGRLRVQVRPGDWTIEVAARSVGVIERTGPQKNPGSWPQEEIWSYQSDDRLRVSTIEGAAVDPAQTGVPLNWQGLPSFRLAPGEQLTIVERSRGLGAGDANRLTLQRQIWLPFDHVGLITLDRITGEMRRDWRLDMRPPFVLQSARLGMEDLLITRGTDEGTGVELRTPAVDLTTVGTVAVPGGKIPATGWSDRFENVSAVLHVPPGHRLLAAPGTDAAPQSWLSQWRLLDLFLVLLVTAAAYRLLGIQGSLVAIAALALTYHESMSPVWLWVNLFAAVALARVAPLGRLRSIASLWRNASFVLIAFALAPFVFSQARLSLYPQLETGEMYLPLAMMPSAPPQQDMAAGAANEARIQGVPVETKIMEESLVRADRASRDLLSKPVSPAPVPLPQQAPNVRVQSGPGIPSWNYRDYALEWSGPVDSQQTMRLVIAGPAWMSAWRIAGIVASIALLIMVFRFAFTGRIPDVRRWFVASAPQLLLMLLVLPTLANRAFAADFPDATLLAELKSRLIQPPECAPRCADIPYAEVSADADSLSLRLELHALAPVAVALPSAGDRWRILTATLDGGRGIEVVRDEAGRFWLAAEPGVRTVRLSGPLAAVDSVQVSFPQTPRRIDVRAAAWDVNGVVDGRLAAGALQLTRQAGRAATGTVRQSSMTSSDQFPAFARVHRAIDLGLDWTIHTTVERIAPMSGAITVRVPLIQGESVISRDVQVDKREVVASIPSGQTAISWVSTLPRTDTLELHAPENSLWVERWQITPGYMWNLQASGTPAVRPDVSGTVWVHEYLPRSGEQLKLAIGKPAAIEGSTLAIDRVNIGISAGDRASSVALEFDYRSTQGGRHVIKLPVEADVQAVQIDGQPVQLRPEVGDLPLSLQPGKHSVRVEWLTTDGASFATRSSAVNLAAAASNVTSSVSLPPSRWILFASGSGVGPAILYWGELVIFLILAFAVGRTRLSPLRVHEWLLLGLGLSTFSWWVLLVFSAWLFAMQWRRNWAENHPLRFNLVQLLLGTLSVVALIALVSAIPNGLLGSPDMRIAGPGSSQWALQWFDDRASGVLPEKRVLSVSIWFYKLAMLAWALWLSFALMRWIPQAWRAYTVGGLWMGKVVVSKSVPPEVSKG